MEDRLLYRVPEVAVILNISRSKVYELFSLGDLESVKIYRIRLVRSSDLRAHVDQLHSVDKSACICWPRSSDWTGRIIARSPATMRSSNMSRSLLGAHQTMIGRGCGR
jgi:excisionase family DNA binding protein